MGILSLCLSIIAFFLLIKVISGHKQHEIIASSDLKDYQIYFKIKSPGQYRIWNKRKNKFSLERRGNYKIFLFNLVNEDTQQNILLKKEISNLEMNHHQNKNLIEAQWLELYHFTAEPGNYYLSFQRIGNETIEPISNLLKFFPLKFIREKNYEIVVTTYTPFRKKIIQNLKVFILFWLMIALFIISLYYFFGE